MVPIIIITAVVIGFIYATRWQNQQNKQRAEQIASDAKNAGSLGMKMEANIQQVDSFETSTNENYSGTTGAIEWQLQTREIFDRAHRRGTTGSYSTQWTSSTARFPNDKFLMMMSTPGHDNSGPQQQKKGILSSLIDKLAEGALDLYVAGYFGEQYKPLINIDGGKKISIPELKEFFILTNDEPMAVKFLNPTTIKYITNWMANKPTFKHTWRVNSLGVLLPPIARSFLARP